MQGVCVDGSKTYTNLLTLLPKDYYLFPSNNANNLYILFFSYCIHSEHFH